jgi:hypothetical protein
MKYLGGLSLTTRMKALRLLIPFAILTLSAATLVWAGCKSDCKDTYQSAIEDCHQLYDSPRDADNLQLCIEDAKGTYNACIEECDN